MKQQTALSAVGRGTAGHCKRVHDRTLVFFSFGRRAGGPGATIFHKQQPTAIFSALWRLRTNF